MRLYIRNVTYHHSENKPPTYDFTSITSNAHRWDTKEEADKDLKLIEHQGISVTPPAHLGPSANCTDLRIEPRPEGGFVISCEYPFSETDSAQRPE
jgi:hypothetical protein